MTIQRGFTLIEMAIVLVIVTILIGGLAMPLSAQIQARRIAETNRTLEEAREALLGYAMTHPANSPATNRYLPCPDTDGDGRENRVSDTTCTAYHGLLPWVDLGVAPQDAWGNRLRYAVVNRFIWKTSGFSASAPLLPPTGFDPLLICTTHNCTTADVAADVVFVLVSHGPNGWGAQNVNNASGNLQAAPSGADEADNLDNGNRVYISRSHTKPDAANGEFDDLTTWVSQYQLIARVCPTGCSP